MSSLARAKRPKRLRIIATSRAAIGFKRVMREVYRHVRKFAGTVPVNVLGSLLIVWLKRRPAKESGNTRSEGSGRIWERCHAAILYRQLSFG